MKNIFLALIISIPTLIYSQDKIVKKGGGTLNCKVQEIGVSITYSYPKSEKILFSIEKDSVESIIFSTGEVLHFNKQEENMNRKVYDMQKKRAIKVGLFSPLTGATEFTYEQSTSVGRSWETSLGVIGLGASNFRYEYVLGAYVKVAYKFIRSPEFYVNKMSYAHILKGLYLAPEFSLRYFNYTNETYDYETKTNSKENKDSYGFAFLLKVGKQWVFNDVFLIDAFIGGGYGLGDINKDRSTFIPAAYGFTAGSVEFPLAFSASIRVGYLF